MWASLGGIAVAMGSPRMGLRQLGCSSLKEIRGGDGFRRKRKKRAGVMCNGGWDNLGVLRDGGAAVAVALGAFAFVRVVDVVARRLSLEQKVSRKVVHILSGVLFMSSWPIFSSATEARVFASLIPLLNGILLVIYGFSLAKNEGLVKSVSRGGKAEELLRGPLYYVFVLMFCVLVFWRDSPTGIISLSMMSGGDGFADIMGRKYGKAKLPYNNQKSWVGSICMLTSGFSLSMGMLFYFSSLGYLQLEWDQVATKVALIALAATVVESLPITDFIDDNISVPLCCILVASLLFGFHTH
ncbi:phytol kinase 1 VTE5 isoform X2 [Wolffia australiana]